MIGQTLAHYKVTAHIGTGGMGEVYRAHDTTLDRDVALKVLPDAFASDTEKLERFAREAKLLASLNHTNIAAIHGFEHAGAQHFLVLELVEGEDLSARAARGPMPVDEVLDVALQVARALEEAHERGIVHRDLKPANIKLSTDGTVKVLDFGLAKALAAESSQGDRGSLAVANGHVERHRPRRHHGHRSVHEPRPDARAPAIIVWMNWTASLVTR